MKRLLDRLVEALAPRLAYRYIRLLRATMRFEWRNAEVLQRVREEHGQFIMAFWHSRLLMMRFAHPFDKLAALASTHRDSEMLARMLVRLDVVLTRGSSTRRGISGMRESLRRMREGYDLAITPDGPRGPRRRVKEGVMAAARFTGKPIVPIAFAASRGHRIASWDGTLAPYPFSRGLYLYGAPILVPRDAGAGELERLRRELERTLDRLTDDADRAVGYPLEPGRPGENA